METELLYSTYPVFRELSLSPKTRDVVRPLLGGYVGVAGLRKFDELYAGLRQTGRSAYDAEQIALGVVTTQKDDKVLASLGAPLAGFSWKSFFKDPKRVTAAIATGGASEGLRAASKSAYDKLGEAVKKGWDGFEKQAKRTLSSLKKVKSIGDVLNIIKMAVSGGVSLMADSGFAALNDMVYDLLAPYLRQMGQVVGSTYAKGRAGAKNGVKKAFKKANKVVREIMVYLVEALYDLALGYPPCVFEEGCIGPVSTGLSNSGVPYVKAIGEALKVIYPIVQGTIYNSPETSQALYAYAGTKGANGAMMLPQAKLPSNFAKTLVNVLEAFDEEYAMGVPKSFQRYQPWLIDLVARRYRGPVVMAARHTPKYYFQHPERAQEVLKLGNKLGETLEWADKWLKYAEKAWAVGKKAYDIYQAVDMEDFSFDPKEWESGDFKKYLNEKALDVKNWADQWGSYAANYAKDYAKDTATGFVEGQKKRVLGELAQIQQIAANVKSTAASTAAAAEEGKLPDLKNLANSLKDVKFKFSFRPGALGKADIATATMTEWQPALIGLMARAKWNNMAMQWLKLSYAQREDWKDKKKAVLRWRDEATDYPAWYKEFNNSSKMRKMDFAYKTRGTNFDALAGSYISSVWRAVASSGLLKDIVDSEGEAIGVKNMSDKVMATSPAVQLAVKQAGIAVKLAQNLRRVSVPLKEQAKSMVPEPVMQAEQYAGLDKSVSVPGPIIALWAAGAATVVAAAITRR